MKQRIIKSASVLFLSIFAFIICTFSANAAILGDVDGNNQISADDARTTLRASVGLETLEGEALKVADTDEDGKITASDARHILRTAVGLETTEHYYEKEVIEEATCTKDGLNKRICTECDDVYEQTVPALGHKYSDPETVVEVTCTQDGLEKYTCVRCEEVKEVTVPGSHKWNIENATCTQDKKCTVCEEVNEKALGHTTDWGTCTRCKEIIISRNEETAKIIKENYLLGKTDVEAAYDHIESTLYANSWLIIEAKKAEPLYQSAKTYFKTAYEACGDIPEFAKTKNNIGLILERIDESLAQIEIIKKEKYVDESNYLELVDPIDRANYFGKSNIYDVLKTTDKHFFY